MYIVIHTYMQMHTSLYDRSLRKSGVGLLTGPSNILARLFPRSQLVGDCQPLESRLYDKLKAKLTYAMVCCRSVLIGLLIRFPFCTGIKTSFGANKTTWMCGEPEGVYTYIGFGKRVY